MKLIGQVIFMPYLLPWRNVRAGWAPEALQMWR